MLSNLHGHLHLPQQVLDMGPYNKTKANRFENMFKVTRNKFHGTRAFEKQISSSFVMTKIVKNSLTLILNKSNNNDLKRFIKNNFITNRFEKNDGLVNV